MTKLLFYNHGILVQIDVFVTKRNRKQGTGSDWITVANGAVNVTTKAGISKATHLDFGKIECVKTFNALFGRLYFKKQRGKFCVIFILIENC